MECYQRALKIDPKYKEAYLKMGFALYDLGRSEEALASYQKALAIDPIFKDAHNNRGIVL